MSFFFAIGLEIDSFRSKKGLSVKRRLGVGAGVGVSLFFQFLIFFAIYLQIDSFLSKKYLLG